MSDETTEMFRAMREWKKTEKEANLKTGHDALQAAGVAFETKNDGYHYIVKHAGRTFDYWPSTRKWRERAPSKVRGHGHESLLKTLGVP